MLTRVRELTVQAANDTNTQEDRAKMAEEVAQLMTEIDSTADRTEFNTQKLLDANFANKSFQIGANEGQNLTISINEMTVQGLGLHTGVGTAGAALEAFGITVAAGPGAGIVDSYTVTTNNIQGAADFSAALDNIDDALEIVTNQRANLGANQNRLEYTINNLNLSSENLSAAKSRIEDADMAKEMMNLTSANVLQQAATSMLAQANQAPNNITQLLG